MVKSSRYYTLVVKWAEDEPWGIEFGDASRRVVEEERREIDLPKNQTKIIETDGGQSAIDEAVARMNR